MCAYLNIVRKVGPQTKQKLQFQWHRVCETNISFTANIQKYHTE